MFLFYLDIDHPNKQETIYQLRAYINNTKTNLASNKNVTWKPFFALSLGFF